MMKRYVGFLALILFGLAFLQAESVWTGNAAVGSPLDFPGTREYFRAASNSFPLGTILEVTNPRGRASVKVTVVSRLESPGVFLLMEMNAARLIGIPSDHIRPVQLTPIGSSDIGIYALIGSDESENEEILNTDEFSPNNQIHAYSENGKDDNSTDTSQNENPTAATAIISEPKMIDDLGEYNNPGETLNSVDAYNMGEAEIPSSISDSEPPAPTSDETENLLSAEEPDSDMGNPVESEKQVVFLSPSDFRPPTEPPIEAAIEPIEQTLVAVREGDFGILRYKIGDRGEYIQIGAYRSREVFEARVKEIQRSNPDYPLRVAIIDASDSKMIYKLLVGPIKPAEIGVVLDAVKRNRFSDAFPFTR